MEGMLVLEPLEHSVLDVALERGSGVGLLALEPLEHSVLEVSSDTRSKRVRTILEPLEHSVPDLAPIRSASPFIKMAESDLLEHSGLTSTEDVGQKLVSLEPLRHSVLEGPQKQRDGSVSDVELRVEMMSTCLPQGVDVTFLDGRPEAEWTQPEAGEAIVVGAVGSAAPWYLTGWAHDVEVEFMIDTGCQVTILAMTVFERISRVVSEGAIQAAL